MERHMRELLSGWLISLAKKPSSRTGKAGLIPCTHWGPRAHAHPGLPGPAHPPQGISGLFLRSRHSRPRRHPPSKSRWEWARGPGPQPHVLPPPPGCQMGPLKPGCFRDQGRHPTTASPNLRPLLMCAASKSTIHRLTLCSHHTVPFHTPSFANAVPCLEGPDSVYCPRLGAEGTEWWGKRARSLPLQVVVTSSWRHHPTAPTLDPLKEPPQALPGSLWCWELARQSFPGGER